MGNYQGGDTVPVAVMAEYFATMRQFLNTQEAVMTHYAGLPQGAREERLVTPRAGLLPALRPADSRSGVPEQSVTVAPIQVEHSAPSEPPLEPAMPLATPASTQAEAVTTAPAAEGALPSDSAAMDRDAIAKKLYAIIEDTTGYPPDMVGADQNLEGDLGIDSIKRVEIVGNLLQELPTVYADRIGDGRKELVSTATMNGMLDILENVDAGVDGSSAT